MKSTSAREAAGRNATCRLTRPARQLGLFAVAWIAGALAAQAGDWNYVVPAADDQSTRAMHAVAHAHFLSTTKPDDLHEENAPYRGKLRRYMQLRYGSPNSIRVSFVVDELEDGTADLYVDAKRNRTIEKRDKIAGAGPDWELPLDVAIAHDDKVDLYRRRVSIHRGASGRTLALATLGYMEGSLRLGDEIFAARRVDGDANGAFADVQDRLWIDKNADGVWDPFTEQRAFATILRLGGERYAARSDTLGHRLTLEPLAGSGSVRLVLPAGIESVEGTNVAVTLVGRDGTAALVSDLGKPSEVPAGEYQIQIVYISLPGKNDSRRWNFQFSASERRQRPWHEVKTGAMLDLDPIGTLELSIEIEGDKTACKPGESLTVQPRLYTGDGLLINACNWGAESANEGNHSKCNVALAGRDDPPDAKSALANCKSGFM